MIKRIFILSLFLFSFSSYSSAQYYELSFKSLSNGSPNPNSDIKMIYAEDIVYLSDQDATIRSFIDFSRSSNVSIIRYEDQLFKTITPFDSLNKGVAITDKDTILGFECNKTNFTYFSNKIEVFSTDASPIKGSPYSNFIPGPKSLVLKVIINGNRELIAQNLEEKKNKLQLTFPYEEAKLVSQPEFEELKIRSRYKTMNVFNEQVINFEPDISKPNIFEAPIDSTLRVSKGTVILKKIKLPEMVYKGANTFISLSCRSNGDAYDRTGSVFAIAPGDKINMLNALNDSIGVVPSFIGNNGERYHGFTLEHDFEPPIEWMRFFTSFGADHFNDKRKINNYPWFDEASYKADITNLIPGGNKEIWIGVFIGNYSPGGHIINLDLSFYPSFDGAEIEEDKWVQPIFNTLNIMEMSGQNYPRFFRTDTLEVSFEIPDEIKNPYLIFTSTGHGGWGGGDEFNPKLNRILIDDQEFHKVVPWRTDCATYRLYNPASGNFENGMSSSDFSRSNWCPGTMTPPYWIPLSNVKPGKHVMKVIIDQGEEEGSSFSAWSISGLLIGEK